MDIQTILLLAILGVCLLLALGALFFRRTVVATVEGFSWERQVFLKKLVWVEESSLNGFPEGSQNQRTTRESYQSYEFVRSETRTITTGPSGQTTTTTEPVYEWVTRWRTKYLYEIQRWVDSRQPASAGEDRSPYWPAYVLDESVSERLDHRQERYLVHYRSARGKRFQRKMPEDVWSQVDEKETYKLKTDVFGRVKQVEPDQELPTGTTQKVSDHSEKSTT